MSPKAELKAMLAAVVVSLLPLPLFQHWLRSYELTATLALLSILVLNFLAARPYFRGLEELGVQAAKDSERNTLRCIGVYRVCRELLRRYSEEPEKITSLQGGLPEEIEAIFGRWHLEEMPSALELLRQGKEYLDLIEFPERAWNPLWKPRVFFYWHERPTAPRLAYWTEISRGRPPSNGGEDEMKQEEKEAKEKVLETLTEVAYILSKSLLDKAEADLKRYESENTSANPKEEAARHASVSSQVKECRDLFEGLCRLLYPFENLVRKHRDRLGKLDTRVTQMQTKLRGIGTSRKNALANRRAEREG